MIENCLPAHLDSAELELEMLLWLVLELCVCLFMYIKPSSSELGFDEVASAIFAAFAALSAELNGNVTIEVELPEVICRLFEKGKSNRDCNEQQEASSR